MEKFLWTVVILFYLFNWKNKGVNIKNGAPLNP
jgi:hypothetical protein